MSSRSRAGAAAAGLLLVAALCAPPAAADATVEGTILDAEGRPVPECRVVARTVEGDEVYVSPPSDGDGRYELVVPVGERYLIVALVAPTGGRVALPDPQPLAPTAGRLVRDLQIPLPVAPTPRTGLKGVAGVDRFFLAFVEDPALAERVYVEGRGGWLADADGPDARDATVIAAFHVAALRRVEIGLRGGFAALRTGGTSESGPRDLELWGKFHLFRSRGNLWDAAVGGLVTLPTGDERAGLGTDAVQSKAFVAISRVLPSVLLLAHAGVRTTEHGRIGSTAVDGRVSGSGGIGVFYPISGRSSAVFEVFYDGERFEGLHSDSRALLGWNRKVGRRGMLRVAVAGGLEDASPDTEILAGFAAGF